MAFSKTFSYKKIQKSFCEWLVYVIQLNELFWLLFALSGCCFVVVFCGFLFCFVCCCFFFVFFACLFFFSFCENCSHLELLINQWIQFIKIFVKCFCINLIKQASDVLLHFVTIILVIQYDRQSLRAETFSNSWHDWSETWQHVSSVVLVFVVKGCPN